MLMLNLSTVAARPVRTRRARRPAGATSQACACGALHINLVYEWDATLRAHGERAKVADLSFLPTRFHTAASCPAVCARHTPRRRREFSPSAAHTHIIYEHAREILTLYNKKLERLIEEEQEAGPCLSFRRPPKSSGEKQRRWPRPGLFTLKCNLSPPRRRAPNISDGRRDTRDDTGDGELIGLRRAQSPGALSPRKSLKSRLYCLDTGGALTTTFTKCDSTTTSFAVWFARHYSRPVRPFGGLCQPA
jgi:hypothetical protein